MIEKLDKKMEFVKISIAGNEEAECLDFEAGRKLNSKINELCDVVNEQQKQIDKMSFAILDLATPNGENKALESIKLDRTKKQLEIAVDALKWIYETYNLGMGYEAAIMEKCEFALEQIIAEQKDK